MLCKQRPSCSLMKKVTLFIALALICFSCVTTQENEVSGTKVSMTYKEWDALPKRSTPESAMGSFPIDGFGELRFQEQVWEMADSELFDSNMVSGKEEDAFLKKHNICLYAEGGDVLVSVRMSNTQIEPDTFANRIYGDLKKNSNIQLPPSSIHVKGFWIINGKLVYVEFYDLVIKKIGGRIYTAIGSGLKGTVYVQIIVPRNIAIEFHDKCEDLLSGLVLK